MSQKRMRSKDLNRSSSKEVSYAQNERHATLGTREWLEWGEGGGGC